MPTHQKHRGPHPNDHRLFKVEGWRNIVAAATDLSALWSKGYSENATKKLVSDHFNLTSRQRKALARVCLPTNLVKQIGLREILADEVKGKAIALDGFNMLIYTEALHSGAYIFQCMDGTYRDIASVHGTYKKVEETRRAALLIGKALADLEVDSIHWYLDAPVSNSGRVRSFLLSEDFQEFDWSVDVVQNPDRQLLALNDYIVCSNDRQIICRSSWFNLSKHLIPLVTESDPIILESDWKLVG